MKLGKSKAIKVERLKGSVFRQILNTPDGIQVSDVRIYPDKPLKDKSKKLCPRCDNYKDRSSFHLSLRAVSGLATYCRDCRADKDAAKYIQRRRRVDPTYKTAPPRPVLQSAPYLVHCPECGEDLQPKRFYKSVLNANRLSTYCIQCTDKLGGK